MKTNTRIHKIVVSPAANALGTFFLKRDDELDAIVSGNKLYKLYHNLKQAKSEGRKVVVTLGGAFSNHIAATAKACHDEGLRSIGIIRGEMNPNLNPTLAFASSQGMELRFVSREQFRIYRSGPDALHKEFPEAFVIPEGGANALGVQGAAEMYSDECREFDIICVAMGTGTTFAGLLKALGPKQKLIGFPVLRNLNILEEIAPFLSEADMDKNFEILHNHHLGGYAKWTPELLAYIRWFYDTNEVKLDPIYTGKMLLALSQLEGTFAEKRVLSIHTGGLQGAEGFEKRFGVSLYA